jgi:hypothetical protein
MDETHNGYAVRGGESVTRIDVDIPDEIRDTFDSLPDKQAYNERKWEKWEDVLLLEYWPKKTHSSVAQALKVAVATAMKRYRFLTEKS